MRVWFLSYWQAAKAQKSLGVNAVSPEPLLLTHGENACCSDRNWSPYCVTFVDQSTKKSCVLGHNNERTFYTVLYTFEILPGKFKRQTTEVS